MKRGDRGLRTWWPPGALRWLVTLLLAAAAIVWLSQPRPPQLAVERTGVARDAPVPPQALATAPADEERAPSPEDASHASGSELVEVCGVGWVEADAGGAWDVQAVGALPEVSRSQRALLESLRNAGELGAAIAAVVDLRSVMRGAGASAGADQARCSEPPCGGSAETRSHASDLLERLAKQATTTHDARVYALALHECEAARAEGSCTLLNAAQWARLDDGNAAPWLNVFARARQTGDAAALQEALYRIGAAPRLDERPLLLAGTIAARAGARDVGATAGSARARDVDAIAAVLLASHVADAAPVSSSSLTAVCTRASFVDANRREACDRAAATLAERADSLRAVEAGTALGRRLGWADERIDGLRGLAFARDAMLAEGDLRAAHAVPASCAGVRRMLALLAREGRVGELGPIRVWLSASGRTIAPFAAQAHAAADRREDVEATGAADAAAPTAEASAAAAALAASSADASAVAPATASAASASSSASSDVAAASPAALPTAALPASAGSVASTAASAAPSGAAVSVARRAAATPYSEAPPPGR
jgi:hypothetical protein